ncbi:MAG: 2-succinyl-5-enolpyruvyl-6-hydroxy-3-cyclohexene-1-carboxylic-acid synthase [Chloroflexi bacterium]|nr:2-succinyl-5-enolpyruvyl-6-hydroxy-3-cyclohexene-1-carboxylic-acid synthase [Chloroflexota bacterium]MQC48462.1 2-succinyl-5-enolpyruvyl-6-hydroxy-3-cyclohexene-1-carboxylic-acid synthase [Chloroflexota bacterium]
MSLPADRYVRALLTSLYQGGVRHVVIAPGSRNTPLTSALTASGAPFRTWLHLDERSAGYFALGLARQLGEPVAVACTSGTAAANFLPSAVEARLSREPVIFLTADRPPEARDVGAAQTVDQVGIFGSHVKWAADLPVADASALDELVRYASSAGARAAAVAVEAPAGPVHLNIPFREPLIEGGDLPFGEFEHPVARSAAYAEPRGDTIRRLAAMLPGRRGLIVAGPESGGLPAAAIASLAEALGWPIVADPLSGLRAGPHDRSLVIDCGDVIVRERGFAAMAAPDVVIRFGAAMTSKPFNTWLAALPQTHRILVDPAEVSTGGWRDPDLQTDETIGADSEAFATALASAVYHAAGSEWASLWVDANVAAREALRQASESLDEPFEGQPVYDLAAALPDGATLVAGNSMPVRDIDSFFQNTDRRIRIVGTRGASGIDGVVSTAVGAAAAGDGPVALLIGDLSFLHDLNGLWPVRRHGLDLTIVLVNNNGGGIFSFLPQRQATPTRFDEWWGTPHGLDLAPAVALHGGRYTVLGAGSEAQAIAEALGRPGLDVLELRTDRDRNVAVHREVWARAIEAVAVVVASRDVVRA